MANYHRVRRRHDGVGISGLVNFLAVDGCQVQFDPTNLTEPALKRATGTKAFTLGRDVVSKDAKTAQVLLDASFPNAGLVKPPDLIGSHCSASKVLEAEVEGPDLVDYSGVGAIDETTAVNTGLSTSNGRHHVAQEGQEINAILRGHLTPVDSANPTRIWIQYVP